jgi:hypothetical protein
LSTNTNWTNRRHIRIPSDNIRRNPKKPRKRWQEEKGDKDRKIKGEALIKQLEKTVEFSERAEKVVSGENVFFVLQTARPVPYEEEVLHRFNLRFSLQVDEHSTIVSADTQALGKFRDALQRYIENSEMKSYLDQIESISIVKLDRISSELSQWMTSEGPEYIEIDLFPNLGLDYYNSLIPKLIDFLKSRNEIVTDSPRIREHIASVRGYLKPQTVGLIVQGVDSVWQTRRAPPIVTEEPQSVEMAQLPTPKRPPSDIKTVCVLDTGVDSAHPFLRHILLDSVDLTNDRSPNDGHGHGTFVAGLAAYGDLEKRGRAPEAFANLISAKIKGRTDDRYSYLEDRIEQATARFHDRAKIFTLSVMYPQCCNMDQPSDLAYTLDKLSHDHSILFVIPSGNLKDELPSLIHTTRYPTYLGNPACSIYFGAEASTAVTVGGVAHKETDSSIARIGQPSPFTRRGEFGGRSKPDVVSNAGNIETDSSGSLRQNDQDLGVVSLGLTPKTLAQGIGTSYSTPVVANILARLAKEYPEASSNLLKALLIHFASWPESHVALNAGDDLKKAVYGKGVPEFEKCAYSHNYSPAYIVDDSIGYDEVAFVPIYVPYAMRNIYGEKMMRVTLVYNPPVDLGVNGYNLVDLDYRLYKQSRRGEFKKQQNWDEYFRRTWDNVKSDIFRWQKTGWGMEWTLMVFPRVRFRNRITNSASEQEYALVVTLEDPHKEVNIYDAIINERRRITKPLEAFIQSVTIPEA